MPTLVKYCGNDDLVPQKNSGGSVCSSDLDLLLSIGSKADVYCPPRKRSRISSSFIFAVTKPAIEILPDECLFEIFRRLPGRERSASACVSKRWLMLLSSVRSSEICTSISTQQRVSASNRANESLSDVEMISAEENMEVECDGYLTRSLEGKKATDNRLAAIAVGTASRGGLGKLLIRGSSDICGVTNLGLSAIAHGCPSLKALSLWNAPSIDDEGLIEIARGCTLLEKLDLCQCPSISNKSIMAIADKCPNLTALTIESCSSIGNEGLQTIGRCCVNLQSITIKDCPLVGDQAVATLLSSTSVLTKVKLQALSITDFSLAVIGHYGKKITNLILSRLQNVSQKGFWVMGNAHGLLALTSLTVSSCRGLTDLSLEAIGKGCPNLKQMCLRKCCYLSDNGLIAFAKAVLSLENLQLEECNRISQPGILCALSNCKSKLKSLFLVKCMGIKDLALEAPMLAPCQSLLTLSIKNCPGVGSVSLAMVGKLCPQLHHLDLSGLSGLTDAGFLPLLENCVAGLVKVNLSDCLNLTDEVVLALAKLHGKTLELLNLEGCRKVTDASLVAIADECPVLSDLDLSKCSITDSGLAALCQGVQHNLQILSVSWCSKVSNKSLPSLFKLGKTLLGLNLQRCNSLSSSSIEQLVGNLWRCDILC